MQSVSTQFQARSENEIRPVTARFKASFTKDFTDDVDFFTIGASTVGGLDIIAGSGNVVQESDKYAYEDYTDRLISVEWQRNEEDPFSVTQAFADVTLDNHDDFFTPSDTSKVLPQRPVRIYAGFGTEDVQVFVGLTEKLPRVDEEAKTVTLHCIDFLTFLFDKPLDEAVIYQDMPIDEIIGELLQGAGISALQYDLDTSFNSVSFAFFDKGTKLGDALRKLVEADLGSLFLTEEGVIRYKNRQNFSDVSVFDFDETNINEYNTRAQDDLINVVEVKSKVREVQANQTIWQFSESTLVQSGQTREIWADFSDPVTSVDAPVFITGATTSLFDANTEPDGSGTQYSNLTVATDLFSKSYKMTFTNTGASPAYITKIELFGTPAKVSKEIYVREQSDDSVERFGEHVKTIENEYIQEESTATSLALLLLSFYDEISEVNDMSVKGSPALQLDDPITVRIRHGETDVVRPIGLLLSLTRPDTEVKYRGGDYFISRIKGMVNEKGFRQILTVRPRMTLTFFTIGISTVGGDDVIAP
jgi:hypothetical protein